MKKLFIITGEHSGDTHASYVVDEIKKLSQDIEIEAIGGNCLKSKGIKLFSDHSKMGSTGLTPKIIFDHLKLGANLVNYLKKDFKPDAVLLIDYGGFNLKIAEELKGSGIKVFYYICPQLWATRKGRIKQIKKYVGKVFLTLPFEKEIYDKEQIPSQFVGHPLVSQLPEAYDRRKFIEENNLDPNKKIVGIFPGSRKMELENLLGTFISAAEILNKKSADIQFCIAQAPNISDETLQKYFKNTNLDIKILKNQNHQLLSCADALILASGTVALEAALYNTPMIISYKAHWFVYFVYLCIRDIKFAALPNIILNQEIIKEFIQQKSRPDLIADEVYDLIFNNNKKNILSDKLKQMKDMLSDKCSSKEVAKALLEEIYAHKKT
ncbi:MAG: lipid-A-disaccharide synthase [bacterium]